MGVPRRRRRHPAPRGTIVSGGSQGRATMKGQPRFDTHEGVVAPRRAPHEINNRNSSVPTRARSYRAGSLPPRASRRTSRRDAAIRASHTPTRCIRRKRIPVKWLIIRSGEIYGVICYWSVLERDGHNLAISRHGCIFLISLLNVYRFDSYKRNSVWRASFVEERPPRNLLGDTRSSTKPDRQFPPAWRPFGNKPREAGIARLAYHSVSNFYIGHCLFRHRVGILRAVL